MWRPRPSPLLFACALASIFIHNVDAAPISFWVASQGGNDGGPGSEEAPFASISRAQAAVRAATANGTQQSGDAVVTILPGTYVQSEPLVFSPADSGSNGFTVSYVGYGAVLYVGVVISSNWSLWRAAGDGVGNIYVTNVSGLYVPPPPPPPPPGCGLVEPGYSYNGYDITQVLVAPGDLSACCASCNATPGCAAWSMCIDIVCGDPGKPINCYLKTSAAGRSYFGPLRTSGTIAPVTPAPAAPWTFFTLFEGAAPATIARAPNKGSGYLDSLGVSNSDSSLSWPVGALPPAFSVVNAQVMCNLGADWFSEMRLVTGVDLAARTLSFAGATNMVAGCNNKAYLQGPKELIDEKGEWALEPASGLLYYYPLNEASVLDPASGAGPIVGAVSPVALHFLGDAVDDFVHDITIEGLEVRGSDFTPDGSYNVFGEGRPNDTPPPTNSGLVRFENAAFIQIRNCKLLGAGLSALFLEGAVQNLTIDGNWIEAPGFCGVATNGPYPGDAPYTSAAASYMNFGHAISNNLIYNVGQRVGHAAGVWLFQTGDTTITSNYIKEAPRNGVGMYGIRFGAGAGFDQGVLPASLYNTSLDFFGALEVLTTRRNTVAFNRVENVVRDTCDSGAFETWGVGVNNTFHTNSLSDLDSGGVDGSWMNFLFSDDASNWLNFSSNVLFNVRGKGQEEATMAKSVFSVFENNVVAFSTLGHAANLQPYIEPAADMVVRRNLFAYLTTNDTGGMDLSINPYTSATLACSSSLMCSPAAAAYNFSNTTVPALSDPVMLELDYNLYFETPHNVSQVASFGWDLHSINEDPLFVTPPTQPAWLRTVADLDLEPASPAFSALAFRRIDVQAIGLGPSFTWDLGAWARRGASGAKIQAETYDRQEGLWREGSFGISPGANGWPFDAGAWAMYARVDVEGATTFTIRITPMDPARTVALALGNPTNVIALFSAADADAPPGTMATYSTQISAGPLSVRGGLLFLLPSGACIIDYFSLA